MPKSLPRRVPSGKRAFDIVVAIVAAPLWIPVCLIAALALLLTAGRPVLYRSVRRVHGGRSQRIVKFRTMVRDAERVLNRDTVPIERTAFLNIPPEHPVYTSVGRHIERYALTEIPQLLHALRGTMSVIGNRPLPENVITALLRTYPNAEDRFLTPSGLTGPVQLVGRDSISDAERLSLEIDYCLLSTLRYSYRIDLLILLNTVLVALHLRPAFSVGEVQAMMMRAAAPNRQPNTDKERRAGGVRILVAPVVVDGPRRVELRELSNRGVGVVLDESLPVGTEVAVPSVSGPPLRGVVCWTRRGADGRFEGGLRLEARRDLVRDLVALVERPVSVLPSGMPAVARPKADCIKGTAADSVSPLPH